MSSRKWKFPRARMVALAVGVGVVGSLAMTTSAMATSPGGAGCNPTDGKISGRGSTFQATALTTFITEYENDVCGVVPTQFTGDPAGNAMVTYNYPGNAGSGSGAGQSATGCRSDVFGGTDKPYTETLLHTDLNGAPGTGFTCPTIASPYTPGLPYPASGAATAPVMGFPVAGGATAMGFNLGTTSCPSGAPTALSFTSAEMNAMMQGTINRWNDPTLVANNPGLANCTGPSGTGAVIQRVTRSDNSGTTFQFMTYLSHIQSTTLCDGVNTWGALSNLNPNNVWPAGCKDAAGNTAPNVLEESGTPGIINCVDGTTLTAGCGDGSIGYGELGIWGTQDPTATLASLQNAASNGGTPVYITPGSGTSGSNCSFSTLGLPGSKTGKDSVSLNGTPNGSGSLNWSSGLTGTSNKSDFTFQGAGYPICGMTWDLMYSNLHIIGGASDPFPGLTADQRETAYTFFSYIETVQGQAGLTAAGYDPLPVSFYTVIRGGIQQFF